MQIKTKIVLLVALAVVFLWSGNAKADYWTRYNSTNSGLPANSWVYQMVKDSRGAKWLYGTASGGSFLYKYDGTWQDYSSKIFEYGGSSWSIQHMYANNSGDVWFNENSELIYFDGSSWSNYAYGDSEEIMEQLYPGHTVFTANVSLYSVFGDSSSSSIYVIAGVYGSLDGGSINVNNTMVLKRTGSGNWSIVVEGGPVLTWNNAASINGSVNQANGDIWIQLENSSGAGVYRYHDSAWTRYTTSDGLVSNNIADFYIDASGNTWIATDRGVSKFDGSWQSWTTDNSNLATNVVTSVDGDSDGKIWFVSTYNSDTSTSGGTSIYNPSDGSWSYYSIRNGVDDFQTAYYIFILGDEMWATVGGTGILALENNDNYTTIYGQVNGATVEKAVYSELKKSKTKSRKVTVWKITRVQKKNKKWKTVRRKVYHTKTSDWYKVINLETGNYMIKVQGKKARTVGITSGDPYRLNF